ncbi:hypothetical protein [Haloferax sp. DFSO52]|uniref:hypothetical protein n=1 Tax=Haloferax sp. DFSO52 TaxID=3388505 RepID=UPI003A85865E
MRLRAIVVAVVFVSVLAVTATGTQSLSTTQLERGTTVNVAPDDVAALGYAAEVDDVQNLMVQLTNTVSSDQSLDVVVEVHDNGASTTKSATIEHGEARQLEFADVSCDATIDVVAKGQAIRIEFTRPVPCDSSNVQGTEDDQVGEGENEDSQGEVQE